MNILNRKNSLFSSTAEKKNPAEEKSNAGLSYDSLFGVTIIGSRLAAFAFTGSSVFAASTGIFAVFRTCAGHRIFVAAFTDNISSLGGVLAAFAFTGGTVFAAYTGVVSVFSTFACCHFITAGASSLGFAGRERAPGWA